MPAPLFTAIAPELISAGLGAFQLIKGNQLGKMDQPKKQISDGATDALNLAKSLATSRNAPGHTDAVDNAESAFSNALDVSKQTGNVDIAKLYGNHTDALSQLSNLDTTFQENALRSLIGEQKDYGREEDAVWENNVNEPYQKQMETASAMKDAGVQNIMNPLSDISGMLLNKMAFDSFSANNPAGGGILPPRKEVIDPIEAGNARPVGGSAVKNTMTMINGNPIIGDTGFDMSTLMQLMIENPNLLRKTITGS